MAAPGSLLVLSASDVDEITKELTDMGLISLMAKVFVLSSSQQSTPPAFYNPQRTIFPTENHTALFMPARICDIGTTLKVVLVPEPAASWNGLPATTMVLDSEMGSVKGIINARRLTAVRNAAGSLLSTVLLAPSRPTHIVAFGAGAQISAHLSLFLKSFTTLSTATIVNRTLNDRLSSLIQTLQSNHRHATFKTIGSTPPAGGYQLDDSGDLCRALADASIIICATSSEVSLFPSSWVRDGTHVILIGSYKPHMREVEDQLVRRALPNATIPSQSRLVPQLLVDSRHACMEEAGEIISTAKSLELEQIGREIGEYITTEGWWDDSASQFRHSARPAYNSDLTDHAGFNGPITMFKSVGIGLQDVAIACKVFDAAIQRLSNGRTGRGVVINGYDT